MYVDDNYDENDNKNYENNSSPNLIKYIIIGVLVIGIIILLFFLFKGKGNSSSGNSNNYVVTLYPETLIVPLGKTQNISYDVRRDGVIIPDANVRIELADSSVAKVENKTLTGLSYGSTLMVVTYVADNGKSYQTTKEVSVAEGDPKTPITNATFPVGDLQMPLNGTYTLNVEVEPRNGYVENKTFKSLNTNVAIVDETGLVTSVSEGETVISIDINNGAFKKDIKVFVSNDNEISRLIISPTSISLDKTINKLKVGAKEVLKYTVLPENASIDNVKWTSSNEEVISVDTRGNINAKSVGTATVTVTAFNNISDSVNIEVESDVIEVTDITLDSTDTYLTVGESQTITPVIVPEDATEKALTYEISNSAIAVVVPSSDSSSATITGLTEGVAVLTIKSTKANITKTMTITVSAASSDTPSGGGGGSSCSNKCKETCPSGQYCYCGKCKSCPGGNYCSGGKKIACAAGKGSVANSTMPSDCTSCAKGYYSTGNGKGCVACPTGKTTKSSGSTSKNDCSVNESGTCKSGEYLDGSTCKACPSGYTSNGGKISKTNCYKTVPAGQYLKTVGGSSTTACPAGSYSGSKIVYYGNTSSCTDCAKGYYQNKTGQSSCVKCPDGKTTSGTGSKNSSACNVDATASPKCSAGQYKDSSGNCKSCPSGYTSSAGSTSINKCYKTVPAGSGMIGGTIYKCPANMYSSSSRKGYYGKDSRCTSCPSGSSTNGRTGQTKCTYG